MKIGLALAVVSVCAAAGAATTNVTFANFAFNPVVVHITAGDTVNFVNQGGTHTVTGDGADAVCGSMTLNAPTGCSHFFPTAGNFPYHCIFHGSSFNMTGMVVVVSAPPPPPPSAPALTNFGVSDGLFHFTANVTASHTNLVQALSDVSGIWTTIGSNATAGTSFVFTDSAGLFPLRLYRVVAH